jgi:hypothetical protein
MRVSCDWSACWASKRTLDSSLTTYQCFRLAFFSFLLHAIRLSKFFLCVTWFMESVWIRLLGWALTPFCVWKNPFGQWGSLRSWSSCWIWFWEQDCGVWGMTVWSWWGILFTWLEWGAWFDTWWKSWFWFDFMASEKGSGSWTSAGTLSWVSAGKHRWVRCLIFGIKSGDLQPFESYGNL